MRLFLLRHGEAGEALQDSDRVLTDKGRKQTKLACEALVCLGKKIDVIVYSPLARAAQTADIAAMIFDPELGSHTCQALAPPGNFDLLFEKLGEFKSANNVLLAGHLPFLGELISQIVWGEPRIEIPLKKSGVAMLDLPRLDYRERGTLRWLLTAKQLARITQGAK